MSKQHPTYLDKLFGVTDEIEDISQEYCQQCGKYTKHSVFNHGDWEVHKCKKCGFSEEYRVR